MLAFSLARQKYWSANDISGFDFVAGQAHSLRDDLDRNLQGFFRSRQAYAELTRFSAWTLIDVGKVTGRLDNSLGFHDFKLGRMEEELEDH